MTASTQQQNTIPPPVEDLGWWRQLSEHATDGPWCAEHYPEGSVLLQTRRRRSILRVDSDTHTPHLTRNDAEFIAAARTAVPVLLDEVTRLKEALADMDALFDLQSTRMAEATALWRQEDPAERSNVSPDLGALLGWLMNRTKTSVSRLTRDISKDLRARATEPLGPLAIEAADQLDELITLLAKAETDRDRALADYEARGNRIESLKREVTQASLVARRKADENDKLKAEIATWPEQLREFVLREEQIDGLYWADSPGAVM
jgi:cell division septum initiation protein DivIVA